MEIKQARALGFCFGVRRAINIIERALGELGSVESLGAIVHNRQVKEELASRGLRVIEVLDDVQGNTVAVTAHGIGPQLARRIAGRGLRIIDTTCPWVKRVQIIAKKLADSGFLVVIFGDRDHPEIQGVLSWANDKGVITLEGKLKSNQLPSRVGIISQTTQNPARFAQFTNQLIDSGLVKVSELRIVNTICPVTRNRYAAALELAKGVDLVIVIGGHNSANTRRLAEVCESVGAETHHVETAAELHHSWLQDRSRIGVTAGTSTPARVIDEVVSRLGVMAQS